MDAAFQEKTHGWMLECFGEAIAADTTERADRFVEEALDLAQATGWPKERAVALIDYVYARPSGDAGQEVGGVCVTLAAFCNPLGISIDDEAQRELDRVCQPDVTLKIRAKQANKPTGSALPTLVHPDDLAVDRFAAAMKAKLAAKRAEGRGGWEDKEACPAERLTALLRDYVEKGNPLDVGNLAMMIHQRGETIGPGGEPDPAPFVADYRNWRGEVERRWLMPIRVWFGRTEWHQEPQWLLTAFDLNRKAERDFALADFHPGHHDGRMLGESSAAVAQQIEGGR